MPSFRYWSAQIDPPAADERGAHLWMQVGGAAVRTTKNSTTRHKAIHPSAPTVGAADRLSEASLAQELGEGTA
ncbi:MAG TPA: hypothetical protein VF865_17480 [Acidobacteriaceae bacterium]